MIYAVGSSSSLNTGPDTAILWTSDGVNPPVLTPLPDLVANAPIGAPGVASRAITRDARFIASVARNHPTLLTRVATRVSTSDLSLLNLMAAPFPTIPNSQGAFAISDDGMIVYVRSGMFASRIDINTSTNTTLPLLPGDDRHAPLDRGMSADGSVMVGFSVLGPSQVPEDLTPFRYVHGVGIEAIPRLGGGTFNRPLALSQDGNLTLLSGNSTHVPNGEVYIYDATVAAAPAVVKFGSPNTAWRTGQNAGGITADGEVSIVNYVYAGCGSACRFPFLHNDNGWFHLEAALGQGGIDVLNLPLHNLAANGISPDGTLVYGQGLRDTPTGAVTEGFVIEFPAGFLANFDVPAVPPAHSSIVGAWFAADTSPSALADPSTANPAIMVFLADGSFYEIEANVPASETAAPTATSAAGIDGTARLRLCRARSAARSRSTSVNPRTATAAFRGSTGSMASSQRSLATR